MRKHLSHPIVTSGLLTIGFTAIVHISNYLYTLVSVRFLTPLEYSDLALIVSFYSLMGIFSAALANTSLSLLSRHRNEETKEEILHASTLFIYFLFIFSLLVLTPIIHFGFHVESVPEIIIILTAGLFSVGNALLSVHFQLEKDFVRNGLFGVAGTLGKLILSFVFLYFGYKIFGVALALFISSLGSFLLFYPHQKIASYSEIIILKNRYLETAKNFLQKHKKFIAKSLVSSLAMIVFLVIDTILAKKLLSPELAAQYIGMSTLAKLFFYTTTALGVVAFPYLLSNDSGVSKRKLFGSFMFLISTGGIFSLLISYFFSAQMIALVLGNAYTLEAHSFIFIVLASIALAFASVIINLSSLLDAAHFNKNILLVAVVAVLTLFLVKPENIQSLALSLSFIFTFTAILLYNVCARKHL